MMPMSNTSPSEMDTEPIPSKEGNSPERDQDSSSEEEELNMESLLSTIMKGVSKAFATSTANKPKETPKPVEAPKPIKKEDRVSIRVIPNETTEISERKYMKIANNGVVRLFELLNQS